jgi:hypothetical protein
MRHRLILLLLVVAPFGGPAASESPYLEELVQSARSQNLAERAGWRSLVHYGGTEAETVSEVDTRNFFLASEGRTDPAAELEATLRAFFRPSESTIGPEQEHPQCRFNARFQWLDEQLGFDRSRLQVQECEQLEQWLSTIDPARAELVFPAAYLNNPSSMFGHTLLRIDPPEQESEGELTSYAINFSAQTDQRNGVLFAVKGLTGMYPGQYALRAYHKMVNEYSEIASRDMWSYPLDFSEQEIERMLRHLWEMEGVSFAYYFLSENCSYQLLRLMETARPGLDLSTGFFYQVEPTATVKRVWEAGLASEPSFRPALTTRIRGRLEQLPPEGRTYVADLVVGRGDTPPEGLDHNARAVALEVAFDLLKHRQTEGEIDADTYGKRALPILRRRSKLPPGRAESGPPPDTAPHRGHDATRVTLAGGASEAGSFVELGFRPSFHALTERQPGFTRGAQIDVLDTRVRLDTSNGDAALEELSVADIISLSPRGALIKPLSWRFRGGYRQVWVSSERAEGAVALEGGIGPAWRVGESASIYGFAQGQLLIDADLPKGASAGVGARAGAVWSPLDHWSMHAWAEAFDHPSRLDRTLVTAAVEQTYAPRRNLAVNLRLKSHGRRESTSGEAVLEVQYYY